MTYINKTQQFYYFQNKAKHYDTIKNIKPAIDNKLHKTYLKTLNNHHTNNNTINNTINNTKQSSPNHNQQQKPQRNKRIPLMKQFDIKVQNQNMINRLVKMYKSSRTQVQAQGNYSRYFKVQRKFRQNNPYQNSLSNTIEINNSDLNERIKKMKPRIGSSIEWNEHFGKTMTLRKNMSRYLDENREKGGLHISADKFIPQCYQSFLDQSNYKKVGCLPKQIQITHEGILTLPNIKSNQKNSPHSITYRNNKLLIDRSRSSLSGNKVNLQYSLSNLEVNPQIQQNIDQKSGVKTKIQKVVQSKIQKVEKKKQKRKLLQFKFQTQNSQNKFEQMNQKQNDKNKEMLQLNF